MYFLLYEQFGLNFSKVCEDQGYGSQDTSSGQSVSASASCFPVSECAGESHAAELALSESDPF